MLRRAFSLFCRQNATAANVVKKEVALSASEIIQRAQEKIKDPKYDASKPIIWIDCEMTGLNHHTDSIIEICCLITDKNLNLIDEVGYESVIHESKEKMDAMDEWCILHHGQSGLTEKVIKSTKTKEQVEEELLAYISKYMNKGVGILAGNSVHMDRLFMLKDMPKVIDYLTYRIIDVSSVMEIAKRFNPLVANSRPRKKGAHTAREDILESIQDLVYYRGVYFKSPEETDKSTIDKFLQSSAWTGKKEESITKGKEDVKEETKEEAKEETNEEINGKDRIEVVEKEAVEDIQQEVKADSKTTKHKTPKSKKSNKAKRSRQSERKTCTDDDINNVVSRHIKKRRTT